MTHSKSTFPKKNESRTKREEILERAEEEFAEHGFQGASLSAVARSAGLGNPGLLHHFPSKAKLYRAVLETLAGELDEHLRASISRTTSPRKRLELFVGLQTDWMLRRPGGFRVIQRELLDNAERVKAAQVLPLRKYLTIALDLIEDAQRKGSARNDVPALAVLCMILGTMSYAASVRPTFAQALARPELEPAADWMALMAKSILRVIGKR